MLYNVDSSMEFVDVAWLLMFTMKYVTHVYLFDFRMTSVIEQMNVVSFEFAYVQVLTWHERTYLEQGRWSETSVLDGSIMGELRQTLSIGDKTNDFLV